MINKTLRRHRGQRHVWPADKRGEHVETLAGHLADPGLEKLGAATGLPKIKFWGIPSTKLFSGRNVCPNATAGGVSIHPNVPEAHRCKQTQPRFEPSGIRKLSPQFGQTMTGRREITETHETTKTKVVNGLSLSDNCRFIKSDDMGQVTN